MLWQITYLENIAVTIKKRVVRWTTLFYGYPLVLLFPNRFFPGRYHYQVNSSSMRSSWLWFGFDPNLDADPRFLIWYALCCYLEIGYCCIFCFSWAVAHHGIITKSSCRLYSSYSLRQMYLSVTLTNIALAVSSFIPFSTFLYWLKRSFRRSCAEMTNLSGEI